MPAKQVSLLEEEVIVPVKESVVMTSGEYFDYSKEKGTVMGRAKGVKTKPTTEELRAFINSKFSPKFFMDKHGLSKEEHAKLVDVMDKKERSLRPTRFTDDRYL